MRIDHENSTIKRSTAACFNLFATASYATAKNYRGNVSFSCSIRIEKFRDIDCAHDEYII